MFFSVNFEVFISYNYLVFKVRIFKKYLLPLIFEMLLIALSESEDSMILYEHVILSRALPLELTRITKRFVHCIPMTCYGSTGKINSTAEIHFFSALHLNLHLNLHKEELIHFKIRYYDNF